MKDNPFASRARETAPHSVAALNPEGRSSREDFCHLKILDGHDLLDPRMCQRRHSVSSPQQDSTVGRSSRTSSSGVKSSIGSEISMENLNLSRSDSNSEQKEKRRSSGPRIPTSGSRDRTPRRSYSKERQPKENRPRRTASRESNLSRGSRRGSWRQCPQTGVRRGEAETLSTTESQGDIFILFVTAHALLEWQDQINVSRCPPVKFGVSNAA